MPPSTSHDDAYGLRQHDAADLADDAWDVAVVGGGPAGTTAALHLARAGHRVVLLERAAYPRDKACGDLLIPDAIAALRRSGLLAEVAAEAWPVAEARISSPRRIEWSVPGDFLTLPRRRLDTLLARGASRAGAVVACGRVDAIRSRPGGVDVGVRGRASPLRARAAVLATGADVSLLETLGMVERSAPSAVAVRAYVRSSAELERLFISFDHEIVPGYAWAFPLGGGRYNVGVGVLYDPADPARHDLRGLFASFGRHVPPVRALLDAADEVGPLRGARLRCGLTGARARGPGMVVAVGEQVGTTYPFTGEGIGKAMETGEMAAAAVARALAGAGGDALDAYAGRLGRELRPRYRGYALAQRWFSRPWLNDLVSWRMRRGRYLRRAARGMVAETVDPAEFCSWRGLLRSMLD